MTQTRNPQFYKGWKLVPIQPDTNMVVDGFEAVSEFRDSEQCAAMSGCQASSEAARICYRTMLASAPAAPLAADQDAAVDGFLADVRAELIRARTKFPGDRIMTIALAEEFGELCKAVLDEPAENVRKEAVQTAVMAARVVLDGDGSVDEWRAHKGLDALTASHAVGAEWPAKGDLVRYGQGVTALAILSDPHAGGWHGRQCMGGFTFFSKLYRPSAEDFDMWNEKNPNCKRQPTEAFIAAIQGEKA